VCGFHWAAVAEEEVVSAPGRWYF